MDRNTVFGLVLIGAILIGFSIFTRPSKEQIEAAKRKADSIAQVEQLKALEMRDTNRITTLSPANASVTEKDSSTIAARIDQLGVFASGINGANEFVTLENDLMRVKLSLKGGRPYSVELKGYKTYDSLPLVLFSGDSAVFSLDFFAQNRNISTQDLYFTPFETPVFQEAGKDSVRAVLRLSAGQGKYIEYVYTLANNSNRLGFNINLVGLSDVIAANTSALDLRWEAKIPQIEKVWKNENTYTTVFYKYYQGEVESLKPASRSGEESEQLPARVKWIAFKQQFFSSVLIAQDNFLNAAVKYKSYPEKSKSISYCSALASIPYNSGEDQHINLSFYFGPNHYNTLKKEGEDLKELVFLGKWIIKWVNQFLIIPIFNFLNDFISSYGLIILILTIIIKTLLLPLTYGSYKSMAKMRVLKPQIDEINAKIPKEKNMERQQAMMALYKKAGVNPMGGCLPLVLQMPILFAMFRFFPTSIELRQQGFLWATDLSSYDSIYQWSANIPILSSIYGNHISLFTILMTVTTILSIKQNSQATAASSNQIPGMQTMMYIMPVMFMFFLNSFSAALTYYYFLTNVITFAQNWLFKKMINEDALLLKINENKKKPVKKSRFQMALEEASKRQGVNLPKKK
ncbi:MAG: membrane protein insertase YidC [Bacteroidales bacterium]